MELTPDRLWSKGPPREPAHQVTGISSSQTASPSQQTRTAMIAVGAVLFSFALRPDRVAPGLLIVVAINGKKVSGPLEMKAKEKQLKELKNGRLAMIAVLAYVGVEAVKGLGQVLLLHQAHGFHRRRQELRVRDAAAAVHVPLCTKRSTQRG